MRYRRRPCADPRTVEIGNPSGPLGCWISGTAAHDRDRDNPALAASSWMSKAVTGDLAGYGEPGPRRLTRVAPALMLERRVIERLRLAE